MNKSNVASYNNRSLLANRATTYSEPIQRDLSQSKRNKLRGDRTSSKKANAKN